MGVRCRFPRLVATTLILGSLLGASACGRHAEREAAGQRKIDQMVAGAGLSGEVSARVSCGQPISLAWRCSVAVRIVTDDLDTFDRFERIRPRIAAVAVREITNTDEDLDRVVDIEGEYDGIPLTISGPVSADTMREILDAAPTDAHPVRINLRSNQTFVQFPESTPFPDLCATARRLVSSAPGDAALWVDTGITRVSQVLLGPRHWDPGYRAVCQRIGEYRAELDPTADTEIRFNMLDGRRTLLLEFVDRAARERFVDFWGDGFPGIEVELRTSPVPAQPDAQPDAQPSESDEHGWP